MDSRGLIDRLGLAPHPEGGWYREFHRSQDRVLAAGRTRSALTLIFFLLQAGQRSRWHRVLSEEFWHHVAGGPLELAEVDPAFERMQVRRLGALVDGHESCQVIGAGCWQAARPLGAWSLVTCGVAPGFDFADFSLLADLPDLAAVLARRFPDSTRLL